MIPSVLLSLLLFGTAFVIVPGIQLSFEPPKVVFSEVVIALLFIFFFFQNDFFKKIRSTKHAYFYLGIITLLGIHALLGRGDLLGNVFRFQGAISIVFLVITAVLSSLFIFKIEKWVIYLALVLELLLTLVVGPNPAHRWIGSFGEPNALAAFIIFLNALLLFRKEQIKWIFVVIASLLVILSGSRSGMIAFGMQLLLYSLSQYTRIQKQYLLVVGACIIVFSLILPFLDSRNVNENRAEIWKAAVSSGLKHPIIGSGFGNVTSPLQTFSKEKATNVQYEFVDSSHSIILDWWVQGGIIGVLLLIGLISSTVILLYKEKNFQMLILFFGLLEMLLFNPASIVTLIAFWWVIGTAM